MSASSSFNEKKLDWQLQDQDAATAAAANPTQYEPILSEQEKQTKVEKDLGVNSASHSTRGPLSRLQSAQSTQSGASELSSEASDAKNTRDGKKKWYKRLNPLKWGEIPPVPETRLASAEYSAGLFSRLTFQWMASLMVVGYKRPLERNDLWTVLVISHVESHQQSTNE